MFWLRAVLARCVSYQRLRARRTGAIFYNQNRRDIVIGHHKLTVIGPAAMSEEKAARKPESFPIDQIYVPVKRRKTLNPEVVQQIAESILDIGQEVPILVRPDQDRFVLVEGLHRLEACKALGETMITGVLVSTQDTLQKAVSPYEAELETHRQKTERLRKLRLEREAAQKSKATSAVAAREQADRLVSPQKAADKALSLSKRTAKPSRPATLAEWLERQKQNGGRY